MGKALHIRTDATPKDRWRTPKPFYDRQNEEFEFFIDAACESDNCLAPFGVYFDQGMDAFTFDWSSIPKGSAVWCNPPYSNVKPFLELALRTSRKYGLKWVFLINVDTSTLWWNNLVRDRATEVRFVAGRIKFWLQDGSTTGGNTAPSAVVVYDPFKQGPTKYSYMSRD